MASNPMQRKSRNSFLLGILVTVLIAGVVIAFLLLALKQKNEELMAEKGTQQGVYVLNQDVKSGQIITKDMFEVRMVKMEAIPTNATASYETIDSWFLQTKEGEFVYKDKYGFYLDRSDESGRTPDTIIEVMRNTGDTIEDSKGNKIANGEYYVDVEGVVEKFPSIDNAISDEEGFFYIDSKKVDKRTRLYRDITTGEFYVYKIDTETLNLTGSKLRIKEYVDIKNVPVLAKIDMNENTVITPNLLVQSDEVVTDDTRQQEYNMVVLPVDLMTNDYVDIRLMTPDGQDFIVVAKAQVDIPVNNDGTYISDTLRVNLREDEILAMSSAIVEAYGVLGSKLYATKYVEPAMQYAALPTYTPNSAVTAQIDTNGDGIIDNPNIVENAAQELATRYSEAAKKARNDYLQNRINNTEEYFENIEDATEEDIGNALTTRQDYLETLNMKKK